MIPKVLHYCFGLSSDFGGKPWSLIHYVCLRSAIERIRPKDVFFYCEHEPAGPWWELSRPMVTVKMIRAPREIFENPLLSCAHRADVVRLEKLISVGGIYLDADVFVHRSFDGLLNHATVMGEQRIDGNVVGLCNAVILSESNAPFLMKWHSEYRTFRSKGHDAYWDEHSVRIPYQLAKQFPNEIEILSHFAFFWPTYNERDLALVFDSNSPIDLSRAYATHLWESLAWDQYLECLTPRRVRIVSTNFHRWALPMVTELPDDYGALSIKERLGRGARQLKRRIQSAV
jgi:hypothetical protein